MGDRGRDTKETPKFPPTPTEGPLPAPFVGNEEGQRRGTGEGPEMEAPTPSHFGRPSARRIGDDDREPNLGGPAMGPAGGMLVGPDHPIFGSSPPPGNYADDDDVRGGSGGNGGRYLPPGMFPPPPSSSFLPPYWVSGTGPRRVPSSSLAAHLI